MLAGASRTWALSSLLGLNTGTSFAGTWTSVPLRGLRALRARRSRTLNVPKPRISRCLPSLRALQTWLQLSDDLLVAAWGSMDRYHLAWLMVGKPKDIIRGRPMTPDEEADYVREVAEAKTAALRMSLDAVERQGMPFVGEEKGIAPGQGMGSLPGDRGT